MVAIEAMATGLPVITFQKGGLKEYLSDGVNGLFINKDNPAEDIAVKIELLMTDASLKDRLCRAGRKTVNDKFFWDLITAQTEKLYCSMLTD